MIYNTNADVYYVDYYYCLLLLLDSLRLDAGVSPFIALLEFFLSSARLLRRVVFFVIR